MPFLVIVEGGRSRLASEFDDSRRPGRVHETVCIVLKAVAVGILQEEPTRCGGGDEAGWKIK